MNKCEKRPRYIVYKHTNPFNNLVYIGITRNDPEVRWKRGYGYKQDNKPFFADIQKFGWTNMYHEILYKGLYSSEAKRLESKLIHKYINDKEYLSSLHDTNLIIYNQQW